MNFKILFASFALVFLAELGDKTQLTALAFTASSRSPWMVFLGTSLALITTTALAVIFGGVLSRFLPEKVMHICSGVMFILMGLILLVNLARKAPSESPSAAESAVPVQSELEGQPQGAVFSLIATQALAFEEEVINFIDKLAARLPAGPMREVLGNICREDREHVQSLGVLSQSREVVGQSGTDLVSAAEARQIEASRPSPGTLDQAGIVCDYQPDDATVREAIEQAIESEESIAEFYLALARMAKIHTVRDAFRLLAIDEIRHAQTLCALINPNEGVEEPC